MARRLLIALVLVAAVALAYVGLCAALADPRMLLDSVRGFSPGTAPLGSALAILGVVSFALVLRRARVSDDAARHHAALIVATISPAIAAWGFDGATPSFLIWPSVIAVALAIDLPDRRGLLVDGAAAAIVLVAAVVLIARPLAARLRQPPPRTIDEVVGSEPRTIAWLEQHASASCVVFVGELARARIRAGSRGPLDSLAARFSGDRIAEALVARRCPIAVVRAPRAGADSAQFYAQAIALAEGYVRDAQIGRGTVAFARRARRERLPRRDVPLARWLGGAVSLPSTSRVELDRPVASDALLEIELDVEDEAPSVAHARVWTERADGGYGRPTRVRIVGGRQRWVVPVDAAGVTRAWSGLRAPPASREARALIIAFEPRRFDDSLSVSIRAVRAVSPPRDRDGAESETPCTRHRDLWSGPGRFASDGGSVHELADGYRMSAYGGEAAELDVMVPVCADACLFAEVGIEAQGRASFRVVAHDGSAARALVTRGIEPGWRQPVEVSLGRFAGERPLALTLVAQTETDATNVLVHRPRVAPCTAPFSIIDALHDGDAHVVPEEALVTIEGDELRLGLRSTYESPPRVELPLRVPHEPDGDICLAVRLEIRDGFVGAVGQLVGVRRDRYLFRLHRAVFEAPHPDPVELRDLALGRFAGEEVHLVFSAWPIGGDGGATAAFVRPQLHRCGERPRWVF